MRPLKIALALTSLAVLAACSDVDTQTSKVMQQNILTASGDVLGTVQLKDLGSKGTEVTVAVNEIGLCEAPSFTSSGGHYNPTNMDHGKMSDNGPHAGDMMNMEVGADGTGTLTVINARVSIKGDHGLPALLDANGSALIIHERGDDYVTQPTGAAGARIGCAELK